MMKIHTTQNLSTLVQQPTNNVSIKEFRLGQRESLTQNPPESCAYNVSFGRWFGKKKPPSNKAKAVVESAKKSVGEIKKKGEPEKKWIDKIIGSKLFEKALKVADHEPVVQGAMSAIICMGFRPGTLGLMSLISPKDKQDNLYASAHAFSSGLVGLFSTFLIAEPFKKGSKYVKSDMYKNLKEEALERINPHLDIKSIWKDKNAGIRKDVSEWLDKSGNKFLMDFKDVDKIPQLKSFDEISAEAYKAFGADVDWAAQKGKSFNDVVTKDGKTLYDAIDWKRVGIVVKRDGFDNAQILLKNIDRDFLAKIIKDADHKSNWKSLDINSVYDKDGVVKDFKQWKDVSGKQWKLDLDSSYISSAFDTADYTPVITGRTREVYKRKLFLRKPKLEEIKYRAYLKNGRDGNLGTEITPEMVKSDGVNEVHDKILTWLPDIITRPFVAAGTIALIPLVLKHVFHLEKSKKAPVVNNVETKPENVDNKENVKEEETNFKSSKDKSASWLTKFIADTYGKTLYESKATHNISKSLSTLPGNMTQHMATLGSFITSGVYVRQTLRKKDLDPDRRRTLAWNQVLCFVVPTACAYKVDKALRNATKKVEYGYSGRKEREMETKELKGIKVNRAEIEKHLGHDLKGVRILSTLATFTLIYRYGVPVIITPIANRIGNWFNNRKHKKEETQLETVQTKRIPLGTAQAKNIELETAQAKRA